MIGRFRSALVLIASMVPALASCTRQTELELVLRFEGGSSDVRSFEVLVLDGACPSLEAVMEDAVAEPIQRRQVSDGVTMGFDPLGPGTYAFVALGRYDDCAPGAFGCVEATLGSSPTVEIALEEVHEEVTPPCQDGLRCASGVCVPGTSPDGGADGGDASTPDAGHPDAAMCGVLEANGGTVAVAPLGSDFAADALTLEAWVRPTSTVGLLNVVAYWDPTAAVATGYGMFLDEGTPAFTIRCRDGDESSYRVFRANEPIGTGTWTHLAVTYVTTGTSAHARVYVDGVSTGELTETSATDGCFSQVPDSGASLLIAHDDADRSHPMLGLVDSVWFSPVAKYHEDVITPRLTGDERVVLEFETTPIVDTSSTPHDVSPAGAVGVTMACR